ncbi:uncharacterized protein LOC144324396 [Canis aureus]
MSEGRASRAGEGRTGHSVRGVGIPAEEAGRAQGRPRSIGEAARPRSGCGAVTGGGGDCTSGAPGRARSAHRPPAAASCGASGEVAAVAGEAAGPRRRPGGFVLARPGPAPGRFQARAPLPGLARRGYRGPAAGSRSRRSASLPAGARAAAAARRAPGRGKRARSEPDAAGARSRPGRGRHGPARPFILFQVSPRPPGRRRGERGEGSGQGVGLQAVSHGPSAAVRTPPAPPGWHPASGAPSSGRGGRAPRRTPRGAPRPRPAPRPGAEGRRREEGRPGGCTRGRRGTLSAATPAGPQAAWEGSAPLSTFLCSSPVYAFCIPAVFTPVSPDHLTLDPCNSRSCPGARSLLPEKWPNTSPYPCPRRRCPNLSSTDADISPLCPFLPSPRAHWLLHNTKTKALSL